MKSRALNSKYTSEGAVVVAQLVERLLLTSEVCGLNPFLVKTFTEHLFPVNCIEKTKIREEEAWNGPFLKKLLRKLHANISY